MKIKVIFLLALVVAGVYARPSKGGQRGPLKGPGGQVPAPDGEGPPPPAGGNDGPPRKGSMKGRPGTPPTNSGGEVPDAEGPAPAEGNGGPPRKGPRKGPPHKGRPGPPSNGPGEEGPTAPGGQEPMPGGEGPAPGGGMGPAPGGGMGPAPGGGMGPAPGGGMGPAPGGGMGPAPGGGMGPAPGGGMGPGGSTTSSGDTGGLTASDLSGFTQYSERVQVNTDDPDFYVITSNGLPEDDIIAEFPNVYNPNEVTEQNYNFRIPKKYIASDSNAGYCLPMGPIGISTDGFPFFNPYTIDGKDAVLTERMGSCNAHPAPGGQYHHHAINSCHHKDTNNEFLGVAFDGIAIYGPKDADGTVITNADLDACHGKVDADGVYRYRITDQFPYILGCFKSEPFNWNENMCRYQVTYNSGVYGIASYP